MSPILIINGHDIIFQIAKTYTMSEIYSRKQTPTAVALKYTEITNILKEKNCQ